MHKQRQRSVLVKQVLVKEDQSNAVRQHKDNAIDCDKECNWVIKRAMLHKQQVLLGLEFYKLSTIGKKPISMQLLRDHVLAHLRHVKRNDHLSNVRELFEMARRNYGAFPVVMNLIEDCQDSLVGEQFNLPPVTRRQESSASNSSRTASTRPPPPMEISTATLEKMEIRVQRRSKSIYLRSASIRGGNSYEEIAASIRIPAPAPSTTSGEDEEDEEDKEVSQRKLQSASVHRGNNYEEIATRRTSRIPAPIRQQQDSNTPPSTAQVRFSH